jgi:hypothetical protein
MNLNSGSRNSRFLSGLFAGNFIHIFRYDGEIAVPSGLIMQWGNGIYGKQARFAMRRGDVEIGLRVDAALALQESSEVTPGVSLSVNVCAQDAW